MNTQPNRTDVIIAAGGLGTRVHPWSRFIPKEFFPVGQRPGILHLFDEIRAAGPANVYFVYNPYYEPFIGWIRHLLSGGVEQYDTAVHRLGSERRLPAFSLDGIHVEFIPQNGQYADLSSVLNGAARVSSEQFLVVFADNLYVDANPSVALRHGEPAYPRVLVRRFCPAEVERRGVVVAPRVAGRRRVLEVIEKPTPRAALALVSQWGEDNLFMVEGRFLLTRDFVTNVVPNLCRAAGEPKLSLAIGEYARTHPVEIVITTSRVMDLAAQHSDTALPVAS